jgi:GMP synthase-like glutamine amidotransferase
MQGFVQMGLVIVEHQADAHAGLLGEWATERGFEPRVVRVYAGDPWPAPEAVGRVVVLGSDRSIHAAPSWLPGELDWLRSLVAAERQVLGVCFGAQALSVALGGAVGRAEPPEIGWFDVEGEDVIAGTWFQWHSDTFTAPPGARELGRSAVGLQGFELGRSLAIQFHPEVTPAIVGDWVSVGGRALAEQRLDGDAIRARTEQEIGRAREAAFALFDSWAG